MTKIAIIYYSLYGHIAGFAESIKKGIEASGATCDIYQVAETLPEEVLGKMGAPPKKDHPIMTADKMSEYDGFMFGISGRFGSVPAQMKVSPQSPQQPKASFSVKLDIKTHIIRLFFFQTTQAFMDSTGGLWQSGGLVGKAAGTFVSTGT